MIFRAAVLGAGASVKANSEGQVDPCATIVTRWIHPRYWRIRLYPIHQTKTPTALVINPLPSVRSSSYF